MDSKSVCIRCGKTTENMRYGSSGPLCAEHHWTPPEIECTPTELRILDTWHPRYGMISGGIFVVLKTHGRTGERRWAVTCRDHWYLDKAGEWTDSQVWSDETRWTSREEAIEAATKAAQHLIATEGKQDSDV